MELDDYFSEIKSTLIVSPVVKSYSIVDEIIKEFEGYTKIKIALQNGDVLEIFVYATIDGGKLIIQKYSFHWQDKKGKLKKIWDNAPHYKELETFPSHLHDGEKVVPHQSVDIFYILKFLEKELMGKI